MSSEQPAESPKMDAAGLWREEVFTDRKVGTIRRLTPVRTDGAPDAKRKTAYVGETSLLTPAGSLPLSFEIQADTLEQAAAAYGDAVQQAFQEAMEELKNLRRKASSQIVISQGGGAGLAGGGLSGLPPVPGKLRLP